MRFTLEPLNSPEIEPLTLVEVKRHLRMFTDLTNEDDDITALISAARRFAEEYTGRVFVDQTFRMTLYDYESGPIIFPCSPILSVSTFGSLDSDGVETAIENVGSPSLDSYQLSGALSKFPKLIPLDTWPTGTLRLTFRAGYVDRLSSPIQDASAVPSIFKSAMKLWIEAHYDRDAEMMPKLVMAAKGILRPERVGVQFA